MGLELFENKVAFLNEWCKQYEHKNGKWPTVREVFAAKLPGFKSKNEVDKMMRYLRSIKDEQPTGD